ncbi:MAG: hypothetical protein ABWK53_05305 [Anaerolineales bacterium]
MKHAPPPHPVLFLRGKPLPLLGLILTSLMGLLSWALVIMLFIVLPFRFRTEIDWQDWSGLASLLCFAAFAAFLGWLFGANAISYWREFFQRRDLYLAVTADALIYQYYDIHTDQIEYLEIPRKDILRLERVTYPGGPESPSVDMVQVWYRKPDSSQEVIEISDWYGGVNLYQKLREVLQNVP